MNRKPLRMLDPNTVKRIRNDIENNPIVLYMNGIPTFPQCSASAEAVQILNMLGLTFKAVNIAQDPSVREGMRQFSNWPTFPQIYVFGRFLGGIDLLRESVETGEFQEALKTAHFSE